MRIKCPACAKLLNVPDSAAGKTVKCPCGKPIRVPTAKTAPANRPQPASAGQQAAIDDSLFDELTDNDLKPMQVGGATGPMPRSNRPATDSQTTDADSTAGTRMPTVLIVIAVLNGIVALFSLLAVLALFGLAAFASTTLAADESASIALGGVIVSIAFVTRLLCVIACFVRHPFSWYYLLSAYAMNFASQAGTSFVGWWRGTEISQLVVAGIAMGITVMLWALVQTTPVTRYYGTQKTARVGGTIANVIGLILGGVSVIVGVMLAQ